MATTLSRRAVASILLLLLVGSAVAAFGGDKPEKDYGLIFGTVYGSANIPRYGVKVKIRPADAKKAKWELYSDHQGEFAQRVPAGDYIVWADVKTKKGEPPPEAKIHVDNGVRMDISLHLTD